MQDLDSSFVEVAAAIVDEATEALERLAADARYMRRLLATLRAPSSLASGQPPRLRSPSPNRDLHLVHKIVE